MICKDASPDVGSIGISKRHVEFRRKYRHVEADGTNAVTRTRSTTNTMTIKTMMMTKTMMPIVIGKNLKGLGFDV